MARQKTGNRLFKRFIWRSDIDVVAIGGDTGTSQNSGHVGRTTGQTRSTAEHNASAEFLRLSFQADYRQDGNTVNVTSRAGMQLVCDEPTRARLTELNQKLLKGGDHAPPENRKPNDTYDTTNPI